MHPEGYYKVWFQSPTNGTTAGLIVTETDLDRGIQHLSRLFPVQEAPKVNNPA